MKNHTPEEFTRQESTRDLFGVATTVRAEDLPGLFVAHIRIHGSGEFNQFRTRLGVEKVPRHIGAVVEAACRRAGFLQFGYSKATAKASRSRIVAVWHDPMQAAAGVAHA